MFPLPAADSPLWLVLSALAVWRVTALLCYDRGPFGALIALRRALAGLGLHRLVACFHCAAIWVGALMTGLCFEHRWRALLVAVALAGAASIVERWLGGAVGEGNEGSDA